MLIFPYFNTNIMVYSQICNIINRTSRTIIYDATELLLSNYKSEKKIEINSAIYNWSKTFNILYLFSLTQRYVTIHSKPVRRIQLFCTIIESALTLLKLDCFGVKCLINQCIIPANNKYISLLLWKPCSILVHCAKPCDIISYCDTNAW